jgi:hypothetical protein
LGFGAFDFFATVLLPLRVDLEAELCANDALGHAQAQISARAHPAPSHPRNLARSFRFRSNLHLRTRRFSALR